MVGAQYIAKDCGVNLLIIQTMGKNLIDSDKEEIFINNLALTICTSKLD